MSQQNCKKSAIKLILLVEFLSPFFVKIYAFKDFAILMASTFLSDFTERQEVKSTLFGHVYRAKSSTGELVVIKEEARLTRKSKEKKLSNEPEIHAKIKDHSNIVSYLSSYEEKTHRYIVMEYCPYGSLKEYVEQNGHLTLHEAQFVLKQLVSALEHIHGNGLLYRNLEPAHILISNINEDGEIFVKLCDFGASRPMKREGLMQPSEDFTALAKVLFYLITGWNFVNTPDVYDKLAVFSETAADLIRQLMMNNSNFGFEDIKSHKFYRFNFSHDETFSKEELESSFRVEEDADIGSSYDNSDDESVSVHADEMEWTDFERENRTPEVPVTGIHFNADFPPLRSEILPNNQPLLLPEPNARHIPTGPGGDYTSEVLDSPQSTEAQAEDVSAPNSRPNSSMGVVSSSEPAHSAIEIDDSEIRMSPCDTVCTRELGVPLQSHQNVQTREKKRFFLFNWIIGIFRWFFRC